jgi:protein associated with RNAse G/E
MAQIASWKPGSSVIIREVWDQRIWTVRPVTVVEDTSELIALYMMPGTVCKHPRAINGLPVPHFLPDSWVLQDKVWCGGGALYLAYPSAWYVTIGFFNENNTAISEWYINLQTPYQRTTLGFDYLDQELDIIIDPSLSAWSWKDEEKFLDAQKRHRILTEPAVWVRQVGEDILHQLENGQFTLPTDWINWKPQVSWTVPRLPERWQHV